MPREEQNCWELSLRFIEEKGQALLKGRMTKCWPSMSFCLSVEWQTYSSRGDIEKPAVRSQSDTLESMTN